MKTFKKFKKLANTNTRKNIEYQAKKIRFEIDIETLVIPYPFFIICWEGSESLIVSSQRCRSICGS
jgi:hypothetical protein